MYSLEERRNIYAKLQYVTPTNQDNKCLTYLPKQPITNDTPFYGNNYTTYRMVHFSHIMIRLLRLYHRYRTRESLFT